MKAFEINPNLKYVNLGGVENDGHLLNFKKNSTQKLELLVMNLIYQLVPYTIYSNSL